MITRTEFVKGSKQDQWSFIATMEDAGWRVRSAQPNVWQCPTSGVPDSWVSSWLVVFERDE